ncbi:MAG: O-antigen ligase domain-containing protein [Bacteroidetes bacterium]|nr:MAG: O-antigen ligase domain-containing protein [Bacteroidota bacterium]
MKQVERVTGWLLGILITMMILRIVSYFMVSESAAVTRVFKVFLRILLTGIAYLLYRREMGRRAYPFAYFNVLAWFFYVLYLLLGIASLMWSSSAPYSALQLVMDVECVAFVYWYWKLVLIAGEQNQRGAAKTMAHILGVSISLILAVFIVGMLVDPEKFYRETHGGAVARLGGFIINPNELGMLIVVGAGAIYTLMLNEGRRTWHLLGLGVLVYTLVLTGSRSSMISFFAVTGFFVLIGGSFRLKLGAVAGGVAAVPFVVQEVFIKEGDVGEVMSMTGRLPFWTDLLTFSFPQRPLFGYGFMRISTTDKFDSLHAYAGAMTHNTFLQVLLNLGMVGAAVVLFQMVLTVRAFARERDAVLKHLVVGVFIPIFVNSLTEFGIFGETNYGIMWYLFIIYGLMVKIPSQGGKIASV